MRCWPLIATLLAMPWIAGAQPQTPPKCTFDVTDLQVEGQTSKSPSAALGDALVVTFSPSSTEPDCRKDINLFVNNTPLAGVSGVFLSETTIRFPLKLTADNKEAWTSLLTARERKVRIAVGPHVPGKPGEKELLLLPFAPWRGWLMGGLMVGLSIAFIALACTTSLLRDPSTGANWRQWTYSLARTGIAWWTLMTVFGTCTLWMLTGVFSAPPMTILWLMGIASGTFVGAAFIDRTPLPPAPGAPATSPATTQGFFLDILSEDDNSKVVGLHRFQMLVWTVVITILFWDSLYHHLGMTDLDPTWLALLGVSNGTYLGFKLRPSEQGKA